MTSAPWKRKVDTQKEMSPVFPGNYPEGFGGDLTSLMARQAELPVRTDRPEGRPPSRVSQGLPPGACAAWDAEEAWPGGPSAFLPQCARN